MKTYDEKNLLKSIIYYSDHSDIFKQSLVLIIDYYTYIHLLLHLKM